MTVPTVLLVNPIGIQGPKGDPGDGPRADDVPSLLADTVLSYTAGVGKTVVAVGSYILTRKEGISYQVAASGASDHDLTTAGGVKLYVRAAGSVSIEAFGADLTGATDSTAAAQRAIDSGIPLVWPIGNVLITDSLRIDETKGLTIEGMHRTVANSASFSRLTFNPATKRDLFIWKNVPAGYSFVGVRISGLSVVGAGPGADAVFNLPGLYKGELEAFVWTNIDHFARVERWLDCNVRGNINGFRVSAFEITNPTLSGSSITTRTDFDVYVSGGAVGFDTVGYDIGTFAIISGRLDGIVESVECAVRMARGNTVDSRLYTENVPRTNAGALFEIGKTGSDTPDGTTVFSHSGVNLHGRNAVAADYSNTIFADIDWCSSFFVEGCDIKRFGGLLKTTSNSKNVAFDNTYAIGVTLLELTTSDIADFGQVTFSSFRPVGMSSPHGNLFQETRVSTTTNLSPQGLDRPRWAGDTIRSSGSNSLWTSIGDGLFDWRLSAQLISTGSATVTPPASIAAGASWQANITTFGALVGDFAVASCGALSSGLTISARVTAADTVTITLTNVTASPISTTSVTVRTFVNRAMI